MSKAFTKETDTEEELEEPDPLPPDVKNLMTPQGFKTLEHELHFLLRQERPRIVEIVSWAAGNGDRSENGDYIYNKKRLREIDRRARYLTKRLENAEIVDPQRQQGLDRVFFGATVTFCREDGTEQTVHLVGIDEADMSVNKMNWQAAIGRALLKAQVGDVVDVKTENGKESLEILAISYKIP
jgi:transcription elongation factor GreB